MVIDNKFEIGQEVYVCKNNSYHEKEECKVCGWSGTVNIKGKMYRCPECNGTKFTRNKFIKKYVPEKRRIRKIKISVYETNKGTDVSIRYEMSENCDGTIVDDRNIIFATLEEAEARCKELNGED